MTGGMAVQRGLTERWVTKAFQVEAFTCGTWRQKVHDFTNPHDGDGDYMQPRPSPSSLPLPTLISCLPAPSPSSPRSTNHVTAIKGRSSLMSLNLLSSWRRKAYWVSVAVKTSEVVKLYVNLYYGTMFGFVSMTLRAHGKNKAFTYCGENVFIGFSCSHKHHFADNHVVKGWMLCTKILLWT